MALSAGPGPCLAGHPVGSAVSRIARLLVLVHRFRDLVEPGQVRDCAEVARAAGVSRARVAQVMAPLWLAPDIQGAVLGMPRVTDGPDPVAGRDLRRIAAQPEWGSQSGLWRGVVAGRMRG